MLISSSSRNTVLMINYNQFQTESDTEEDRLITPICVDNILTTAIHMMIKILVGSLLKHHPLNCSLSSGMNYSLMSVTALIKLNAFHSFIPKHSVISLLDTIDIESLSSVNFDLSFSQ